MITIMKSALGLVPFSVRSRIKSVPGLAYAQNAIVSRSLDGREFEHRVDAGPAKGITFLVRMPEDKGIWTGTYEIDFSRRLAAAVRPGTVCYDIGSWHGFFAGVMVAQGASRVDVFEPLPANGQRIRRLIELNPSRTIELHAFAVSDCDGAMDLIIGSETSMAKLESSDFQSGHWEGERIHVPVRSIDSIVASGEAPPPALIKIDVEGAEVAVLKGARSTIRSARPEIFVEAHSSALLSACIAFLEASGYEIEHLDRDLAQARERDVYLIRAFAEAGSIRN